jgi:hypothetical protein
MASNRKRLVELGMVPPLADELGNQIDGVTPLSARRLMEMTAVGPLAKELVRQMTAGVGDRKKLTELGVPGALAAEIAAEISPLSVIVYRTRPYVMYGSSTYGSTGNGSTIDGRNNTVPVPSRNVTYQTFIKTAVPTLTGQDVTNQSVPQVVGNGNSSVEDVRLEVIAKIGSGFINNTKGVFFGTPNTWSTHATIPPPSYQNTMDTTQTVLETMEALDAVSGNVYRFMMWTFQVYSSGVIDFYAAQKTRLEKISKQRGPRLNSGWSVLDEAYRRELPTQSVADDVTAVAARYRPQSMVANPTGVVDARDPAHSNGEGYRVFSNYTALPIRTWEGGLPFISPWHYHKYLTAAGEIATIVTMGDLTGCTFTISDPVNYSVSLVPNPSYPGTDQPAQILKLYLTAAGFANRPIFAPTDLNITVSKPGYGSETYRISVAIQRRDPSDNTPQKVTFRQSAAWFNGYNDDQEQPLWSNTRQFTMFLMIRMNPWDGNQLQFYEAGVGTGQAAFNPAAGSSDSAGTLYFFRVEKAPGIHVMRIRRTGSNTINVECLDSTGATNFNTTTTGTLTQDHGWRMLSIHYDADNADLTKNIIRLSEGRFETGSRLDYAAQTTQITIVGNGTIQLGAFRAEVYPGTSSYSQIRLLQDGATLPTLFLPCSIWRWVMTAHYIDGSASTGAANLAAMWQPARVAGDQQAAALALPGGGSTLAGVDFDVDFRGDAAEWCSGCDDVAWTDVDNGAKKIKNFGTKPGFNITTPRPVEFAS